ncbi:hypothetical protein TNCV_3662121 [Trichonephila clavipes]|nr:hypothetical protein TNCV_3662121 [Trichonephila clavipes]
MTSCLSSFSTNLIRGLAARRQFRVPPCRKGTIHLQTSIPSPGFEPRPYGTAVSLASYTAWVTEKSVTPVRYRDVGILSSNIFRGSIDSESVLMKENYCI